MVRSLIIITTLQKYFLPISREEHGFARNMNSINTDSFCCKIFVARLVLQSTYQLLCLPKGLEDFLLNIKMTLFCQTLKEVEVSVLYLATSIADATLILIIYFYLYPLEWCTNL